MLSGRSGMFSKFCVFLGAFVVVGLGIGVGVVAQSAFGSSPDASIEKLLSNPGFNTPDNVRAAFQAGQADWRIVALLNASLEHHQLGLGALSADGRGATVVTVDGAAVGPSSVPARDFAGELGELGSDIRPASIGTPFTIAGAIYFTDAAHQNHIEITFGTPTPPPPTTTSTTQPVTTTTEPAPPTTTAPPPTTTTPSPTTTAPPPSASQPTTTQPAKLSPNPPATSKVSTVARYGSVKRASIKPLKKSLRATFLFATIPTRGSRLQIVWSLNNKRLASNAVPLGPTVTSSLLMLKGPIAGIWKATLRAKPPKADWKTVKETRLRIE